MNWFRKKMKTISILIIVLLISTILGTGTFSAYAAGEALSSPPDTIEKIFPDPSLAAIVSTQLGVPVTSTVTQDDLDQIVYLAAINKNIIELTGIGYLRKLQYLDLSYNKINVIPQEVQYLTLLSIFSIGNNQLTALPQNVLDKLVSLQKIEVDNNKISNISEIQRLPVNCIKSSMNQTLNIDLGTLDTNQAYTLPVSLPQIFTSQNVSITSGNATISTDASGNKTANVLIGSVGYQSVIARIESGTSMNTTYAILYNVTNSYQLKIPVINATLNNTYTSSVRPLISGTAIAGSSVMVMTDGKEDTTLVLVNNLGNWSYTPSVNLIPGKHLFTAKSKDISNIWSAVSTATAITIDTTPPAKPVIASTVNNAMFSSTRPTITGTAEANAYITLNIDSIDYSDCTVADASGKWSYTLVNALSAGNHSISAKSKDHAGNYSLQSASMNFTIDNLAPQVPTVDASFNQALLNSSRPVFTGTGEVGTKINVYVDTILAPTIPIVDSSGKWKYVQNIALVDGVHTIYVSAKDAAGNVSSSSTIYTFRTDTIAPSAPIITVPANNLITNIAKPLISGKSEINTTVVVYIDSKASSVKLPVDNLGNWMFTPATNIADGIHKLTAKAYDAANNESSTSIITTITIKTAPPNKPVIDVKLNNTIVNNKRPLISGTADPKSTITLNIDGIEKVDCAITDLTGKWMYSPDYNLADGKHTISAKAKDVFNNIGSYSSSIAITIDSIVPAMPLLDASFNGALLNSLKPEITGTAEIGVSVYVIIDGVVDAKPVKSDIAGKWKFIPSTSLTEGGHQLSAKAIDAAGNTSATSGVYIVTINVTPPNTPRIALPISNILTNDSKIVISGQSDSSVKIHVYVDGVEIGSTNADASGNWTFKPTEAIKDGKHNITVKARNKANNLSPASYPIIVTIDTTPPTPPKITSPMNNLTTNNQKLIVSGTAEIGAKISLSIDGNILNDCAAADSTGKWSYSITSQIASGAHSIAAKAKDGLGNISEFGEPINIIIDMSSPVVSIDDIGNGNVVNDTVPLITGSVKPNSKVFLWIDDKEIKAPITADSEGLWKYKSTIRLIEGNHAISARATDSAGNSSTTATVAKFIVDLTPPALPEIKAPETKNVILTNNPNPELSGIGEPNAFISIYVDNQLQEDIIQIDGEGNWIFQLANGMADGKHAITLKVKDQAGNLSKATTPINMMVDTIPPVTPILSAPLNNGVYKTSIIQIKGSTEKGAQIIIAIDGLSLEDKIFASDKGSFSYTLNRNLSIGKHTIDVSGKDLAQNISAVSSAAITIDSATKEIPPKTPIISKPKTSSKTKDKRPYITGTTSPNATVTVKLIIGKKTVLLTTKSNKSGVWSVRPKSNLAVGSYKVTATAKLGSSKLFSTSKTITIIILK